MDRLLWVLAGGTALGVVAEPPGLLLAIAVPLVAVRRRRVVVLGGVFLLGCGAGGTAAALHSDHAIVADAARRVPVCFLEGTVLQHAGGLGTLVSLQRLSCPDLVAEGRIGRVVADGRVGILGGMVSGEGRLVPLVGGGFVEARARLGADAEVDLHEVVVHPPTFLPLRAASSLRDGVAGASEVLEPRRGALLAGLTIGDTSGMDEATEERLRRAGLSHLVAVSGSNVAIVIAAVALPLRRLGRIAGLVGAALALCVYVLAVGPEPSVLRAGVMGAIGLAALATGRRSEPFAVLALGVTVLLLVAPPLVWSVGLHLSVVATAGLILWSEPIAARLAGPRTLRLAAGATLAAQIAVAPLLIGVFGEISVVGPLANLLAVPAVPVATVLGLLSGSVSVVGAPAGGLIARLAEPAVAWILAVGDALGGQDWASIAAPAWVGMPLGVLLLVLAVRTSANRTGAPRRLGA